MCPSENGLANKGHEVSFISVLPQLPTVLHPNSDVLCIYQWLLVGEAVHIQDLPRQADIGQPGGGFLCHRSFLGLEPRFSRASSITEHIHEYESASRVLEE